MLGHVARWGNSLGIRIPKSIAQRAGLTPGAAVEIEARQGKIVITSAQPHYTLAELLVGMTPKAMRNAFDWGDDVGREDVED
jgi:antitoxin MazE